jgi:hypothetical protein
MQHCTNCNAQITCSCQVRIASNGTTVCSGCLYTYEDELRRQRLNPENDANQ